MSLRSWLKSFAKTTRETSHTYKPNTVHAASTSISENEANRARDAGRAAYEAKDFATAIDCFSRVIQCAHDDAEAHNYLGLCYLERGEYEDASDSFTLASHFKPDFAQPFFNLASLGTNAATSSRQSRTSNTRSSLNRTLRMLIIISDSF